MAGVDDQAAVARWLYSRLAADEDLAAYVGERIYPEGPPQSDDGTPETDYPFLSFSFNRARNYPVTGGRQRGMSDQYVAVQVEDAAADYDRSTAAMQAVDASLTADDAEGVVTVGEVDHYVSVARAERPYRMPDFSRGQQYRISGRIYFFEVFTR